MTKQEILHNVYNRLRFTGAVRSKRDLAEKIGYNYSCTSSAFNGVERYLSDRFFTRILRAFPQVNADYIRTGVGEILLPDPVTGELPDGGTGILPLVDNAPRRFTAQVDIEALLSALNEQQELTRRQQEQTEKALEQIDRLIEIIQTMSNQTEEE